MRNDIGIGVDIGRVIIEGDQPGGDTSFIGGGMKDVLGTPPIAGALEAVRRLNTLFQGRVWLVSKCGKRMEEKSLLWLRHHDFSNVTGVPEAQMRFCRERPQKADHARELGLSHFVDDRIDVLENLRGIVPHLYHFGAGPEGAPEWLVAVRDWQTAEREIIATLNRSHP